MKLFTVLLIMLLPGGCALAQTGVDVRHGVSDQILFQESDSGIYITELLRAGCKNLFSETNFIPSKTMLPAVQARQQFSPATVATLISVHGNVTYNFNYRSYIDTPFAQHHIMQHSVQTQLNVKIKDRYPFSIYLNSRRSNSLFFSNATDVSVQFRQSAMLENIKSNLKKEADDILQNKILILNPAQLYEREKQGISPGLLNMNSNTAVNIVKGYAAQKVNASQKTFDSLYAGYKSKIDSCNKLNDWIAHPSRIQEIIEEKEKQLRDQPLINNDSIRFPLKDESQPVATSVKNVQQQMEEKKQKLETLKRDAAAAEKKLRAFQKKISDSLQFIKKQIAGIKDKNTLYEFLREKGGSSLQLTGLEKTLLAVRQIGVGRSWIDYSELTVKNISLNGINIEMNPGKIYFAAAAGKVNYRFRDYIVKGDYAGSGQSVGLLRAGIGQKEKNNLIITYYAGKKSLLNQRSIADSAALQKITGLSVESSLLIDAHNYITAEYARSISPNIAGKLFNLKSSTNEAWSLKLASDYGNTLVNAYYRHTGEGFQSFTLYPSNNKQDAWMLRVKQSFWKKRLLLDAAVRKNDFESPVAAPDFSNKNIFRSLQLTIRIPKYPFISVGYYPSSQLTLSNNNLLYENRYNTLNAIISHSYFMKGVNMNSNATFTRFYNSGSDSGFVYYNASAFTFNHSINFRSFIVQGIITITDQSRLHQLTAEPVLSYAIMNKLSITGSIKWSRINHTETLWGGTGGLTFYLKNIGTLQMQYDKIFLPGYNRDILPVDMGRLTFSRQF